MPDTPKEIWLLNSRERNGGFSGEWTTHVRSSPMGRPRYISGDLADRLAEALREATAHLGRGGLSNRNAAYNRCVAALEEYKKARDA